MLIETESWRKLDSMHMRSQCGRYNTQAEEANYTAVE